MMCEMIKRNDLLRLSETVIKPFYYPARTGDNRDHSPVFTGKSLPDP
ncbi:valine--pyruvate transaminase [Citrobacter koseri]|uniref:Valine--pyruvate transaminase n=1 Tax=Citrobacter koseri TaxID=545 RepID=A0A447UMP7_CITKO|nr:valine--pyruvate transaminase [Citrobacter koseri]